jgi:choline dehydrogenase-like flavoprotein
LCDEGLKTLVLERGRDVKHVKDYPTASKAPWELQYRGSVPIEKRKDYQFCKISTRRNIALDDQDDEQPFIQEKPFGGFAVYHMGGKSLLWARQTQRWSDFDLKVRTRWICC